ncbi:aminodeoxychorismate lyase [Halomonas urumqiensis]|uniref:Aminodeoxychorismate lyase n=1 Tax=Halomonas urumqiensis TaxID=1684789 RepID=A0A2N7UGH8_9GAMM|nr:aminodeoxychorismate lyase [Halomonas urumqiensis]PTB01465.1 aminodeoxychorismate lyase [Halomonas urumqiensis]
MDVPGWPLDDRGAAYGDGLFETVLVRDGQPQLWLAHVERLARGCAVLGIPVPERAELERLLAAAPPGLQVLKLVLTRGSGGRGYRPPLPPTPRLRHQWLPFAPDTRNWVEGVRVRLCHLRLGSQPLLAGLKHLNRLENVMARAEWSDDAIAEGLLTDSDDRLVEATAMNLFWQRDGRLQTPWLGRCGVAGTLRDTLIERLGIDEVDVSVNELRKASAVWVGNSVQGIWPVRDLEDAEGVALANWSLNSVHRAFQAEAHALLGFETCFEACFDTRFDNLGK